MNKLTETRHGLMWFMEHDNCIGTALEIYGEWSLFELQLLGGLLKPGDHVLDVGANIGTHTTYFAKCVGPTGRVLAFEPQHPIYQVLCANIVANHLTNVVAKDWAVGEKPGRGLAPNLNYAVSNNLGACPVTNADSQPKGAQGQIVEMVSIDALELQRVDLIKADIEGGEYAMIMGARATIARHRPKLYLESHNGHEELCRLVKSLGYRGFVHMAPSYNPSNWKKNAHNIHGDYLERNVLCVPKEQSFVTALEEV